MFIIGIILILMGSFLSIGIAKLEIVKSLLDNITPSFLPSEFILNSFVFIIAYIIYFFIDKYKTQEFVNDVNNIINTLNKFFETKKFEEKVIKVPILRNIYNLIKKLITECNENIQKLQKKIIQLEEDINTLEDMVDLQQTLVCKVNESGKVIKANKKFLKFFAVENESKLNLTIKSVKELFGLDFGENWLNEHLDEDLKVEIKGRQFILNIEKVEKEQLYVISLLDVSEIEEMKRELEKKFHISDVYDPEMFMNKTLESTMFRIVNYEDFAQHLGSGILEVFEEQFVEKIKSFGYDEVFKIQNDIFAVYASKVPFDKYKKILEETIVVSVGGDEYIFNPKVVIASGVNYEQAYQQIIESTYTLVSKEKTEPKYSLDLIKLINKSILENKLVLGYKVVEDKEKTIIVYPSIKDEYGDGVVDQELINTVSQEFNLYLSMLKQVFINNLDLLKNYKIIINVTSKDLLSTTMLVDLLLLIKREELLVSFNVDINSTYSVVLPILKQIKSFAQLGFRNVGKGYISFKDIYALKIEYLEIDDSIIKFVKSNENWAFLLKSIKLLASPQNVKLLANDFSDQHIIKISEDIKIYQK